jgi:hypothetical protein
MRQGLKFFEKSFFLVAILTVNHVKTQDFWPEERRRDWVMENLRGETIALEPSKRAKAASLRGGKAHTLQGVVSGRDSRDQAQKNRWSYFSCPSSEFKLLQ